MWAHVRLFIYACGCLAEDKAHQQRQSGYMCVRCWWRRERKERGYSSNSRQWSEVSATQSDRQTDSHSQPSWNIRLSPSVYVCEVLHVCVWVYTPGRVSVVAAAHSHTQETGMREREELRRAIEQSDRLLSKVRELEEQNTQLNKEKNEVATKYRAVSLLLCSDASPSCFSFSLSFKKKSSSSFVSPTWYFRAHMICD